MFRVYASSVQLISAAFTPSVSLRRLRLISAAHQCSSSVQLIGAAHQCSSSVRRLRLISASLRARDFYEVIVDEGEARINYHFIEIESE